MDLLDSGVSRVLTDDRLARLRTVRCALHLAVPADPQAPISGRATLRFLLRDAASPVVVDFAPRRDDALSSTTVNGREMPSAIVNGHIVLDADALRIGENVVEIAFTAGDLPLNRRDDYLYSLFVPARARETFPCFDQPSLRAVWSLSLDLPATWTAVSNAPLAHHAVDHAAGRALVRFADTLPLPTYLFAFAAGRFAETRVDRDGHTLGVWHIGVDAALLASNLDALVDGHAQALAWMEDYTAVQHPFPKLDLVVLPAFQFGGMEHPGAIYYNAAVVLLGEGATRQQQLARANVIAHETAHLWFGDLVTMRWFDDVWLKEVFASFMAAQIVNPQFTDLDHDLRFLQQHYPAAYDVDRTDGTNPIRQPLDNLADAGSLYGPIVYLKSPIVMRQLEQRLGAHALRAALREYLSRFAFGSASWLDLLQILTLRSGVDLARWSHDWIDTAGRPVVEVNSRTAGGHLESLVLCTQVDGTRTWPQPIRVTRGRGGALDHVDGWIDGAFDVPGVRGTAAPDFVLPNGGGLLYADCRLDAASARYLLAHLADVPDPLTRGCAWLALWDTMLAGQVPPAVLLDTALRTLGEERDDLNRQRLLTDVERLVWTWGDDSVRFAGGSTRELALRSVLGAAPTSQARTAVFNTLRSVTTTDAGTQWLYDVWAGRERVERLSLGDAQRVALAMDLAVRRGDGDEVLEAQAARTAAPDLRDALRFLSPALSGDPRVRSAAFDRLRDVTNRRREPWVVETMRWLHHPLRAPEAVGLIRPGLDVLDDIRRTGDIFLPKRWSDAMLAGHRSPQAARVVQQFLDERTADYPDALRRLVLTAAHHLGVRGTTTAQHVPRA